MHDPQYSTAANFPVALTHDAPSICLLQDFGHNENVYGWMHSADPHIDFHWQGTRGPLSVLMYSFYDSGSVCYISKSVSLCQS